MGRQFTQACQFTAEDVAIINSQNPETMASMLVGDCFDSALFSQGEWDSFYAKRQQWELDNIY